MTTPADCQALATGARPGTQFYAPSVELLDENSASIVIPPDASAGGRSHPVHADIERAEVTQTHHGAAQMSVTLNNQRHELSTPPKPIVPFWKYNRFDYVRFGNKMLVNFGYVQGANQTGSESSVEFQKNLMIRARITDMTYAFPNSGGAKVTLKGEDAISLLNAKPATDTQYRNKDEIFMVNDALTRSSSGLTLATGPRETLTEPLRSVTHSKTQSYFQFIEAFAKRLDYEVWIDIDDANKIHFEKSRSLVLDEVCDLTWDKDLIDFNPKFKGWDVYTRATAGGSNPSRRAPVREVINASEVDSDLHASPEGGTLLSAVDARRTFFSVGDGDQENSVSVNVSNLDDRRAELMGAAELRRSAREFLTADATTIGMPSLRPGIHVNIKKLYAPFDGLYYVTQVTHTIDASGYRTKLKLRRPGMLDPSTYPGSASGG